jgi:hypothetical protein
MKTRLIGFAAVVLLLGAAGSAQGLAELLQKGIYTQDTLGDVDAAIRIYQQVVSSSAQQSELRIQAERRLRSADGERRAIAAQQAAQSAQTQLLQTQTASNTWRTMLPEAGHQPLATLEDRTYRHTWTGITFEVPAGWKVMGTVPSSDRGEMALMSTDDPAASIDVWMIREPNARESISQKLDESPLKKAQSRLGAGFQNYRLRPGSVQRVYIAGEQAIIAIADYTERQSQRPMAECMTWIFSGSAHMFFFAQTAAEDLDRLRPQLDAMVYSTIIP